MQVIRREVITHRQLSHPNVLKLIGVYRDTTEDDEICPLMMILPVISHEVEEYLRDASSETFLAIVRELVYLFRSDA